MTFQNDHHRRRSIRLRGYDYSQAGAYFVTMVAHGRALLFGDVVDKDVQLNALGQIAKSCWEEIPTHVPVVELDEFVIMPNHVHGILVVHETGVGATPLRAGPRRRSLGSVVGSYKSAVSRKIKCLHLVVDSIVWQRNYYEHIIRDEESLLRIRQYIQDNPAKWEFDSENLHGLSQP